MSEKKNNKIGNLKALGTNGHMKCALSIEALAANKDRIYEIQGKKYLPCVFFKKVDDQYGILFEMCVDTSEKGERPGTATATAEQPPTQNFPTDLPVSKDDGGLPF